MMDLFWMVMSLISILMLAQVVDAIKDVAKAIRETKK
jgi:hypothetical protein